MMPLLGSVRCCSHWLFSRTLSEEADDAGRYYRGGREANKSAPQKNQIVRAERWRDTASTFHFFSSELALDSLISLNLFWDFVVAVYHDDLCVSWPLVMGQVWCFCLSAESVAN